MYEKLEVVRNRQLVLHNQTTNFAQDEELKELGMYICHALSIGRW